MIFESIFTGLVKTAGEAEIEWVANISTNSVKPFSSWEIRWIALLLWILRKSNCVGRVQFDDVVQEWVLPKQWFTHKVRIREDNMEFWLLVIVEINSVAWMTVQGEICLKAEWSHHRFRLRFDRFCLLMLKWSFGICGRGWYTSTKMEQQRVINSLYRTCIRGWVEPPTLVGSQKDARKRSVMKVRWYNLNSPILNDFWEKRSEEERKYEIKAA
jgi:hypothetical protein